MSGTTLPTPLYGLYQQEIGISSLTVTVLFSVYALGVITVLTLAGDFSDVLGRKSMLLAGLAFAAGSGVCFLFQESLALLFVGRVLSGFSAGLFTGVGTVAILELAPEGRLRRASLTATAANMLGLGCGPLLAGLLAQYAPSPLRLPYLTHLGLVAVAAVLVPWMPETVRRPEPRPSLTVSPPSVPPEVRSVFRPAALAAFVGFAMFGLFTAVAPSFMDQSLGVHNLAVEGSVVFLAFAASTLGQWLMGRVGVRRALPLGCFVLLLGVASVGAALLLSAFPLLVLGAAVSGLGQGLLFRSGLVTVSGRAPADRRAETTSAFFVAAYLGISLPIVGVGALSEVVSLRDSGLVFSACAALLAGAVGWWLTRHPPAEPSVPA
ncbi:MFS transporter [Streptomyces sp. NPDC005438]|uniref:MFS transporter n=1 Tax=Streptomyces sp. NPDC005438 TaxID=3156880 RepID=UPI0033A991C0